MNIKKISGKEYIFLTQTDEENTKMIKLIERKSGISFRVFKNIPLIENKAHYLEPNDTVCTIYIHDDYRTGVNKVDVAEYLNGKPTGVKFENITEKEFEMLDGYNEKLKYKIIEFK